MYNKLIDLEKRNTWGNRQTICIILLLGLVSAFSCFAYFFTIAELFNSISSMLKQYPGDKPYLVVCYYSVPGNDDDNWSLLPSKIDPHLCTHIIVGFADIDNCSIALGLGTSKYKEIVDIKQKNPDLKIMLSVGGAGQEMSDRFKHMTENHAKRKVFIASVLKVLEELDLDGLDIDWEYPSWLHTGVKDEKVKIHYVQLLQELRKAFDRSGRHLTLSVAVAAPQAIIDQSYNVPQIAEHIDFINLMSYDYHFYVSYFAVTDLNSPLFGNEQEKDYLQNLNVNFSANYWVEQGMPRDKIVVGIPTYGHSYELFNYVNHGLHAPAKGFGKLGDNGFVNYSSICNFLRSGATTVFVTDSRVPYAYKDNEWISYDDVMSVTFKALWIKENNFRGAMVYCLNSDDWTSTCIENHTFPLIRSINYALNKE